MVQIQSLYVRSIYLVPHYADINDMHTVNYSLVRLPCQHMRNFTGSELINIIWIRSNTLIKETHTVYPDLWCVIGQGQGTHIAIWMRQDMFETLFFGE